MKRVQLRYVAAVHPITGRLVEEHATEKNTLRELIQELDDKYGGFVQMFVDPHTGRLTLNTMIYYGEEGKVPIAVLDLDQKISDGARITFW